MRFKFIYAKHKIHPKVNRFHKQWYLLIEDSSTLNLFLKMRSGMLVKSYDNVKIKRIRDHVRSGHYSNRDESIIDQILTLDHTRKTLLDDCNHLDNLLRGYIRVFFDRGHIIVSPNNSFRCIDETFKTLHTVEKESMVFPMSSEKDIRVIQWQNGTHYYAKIGNTDVFWKGKQKWNSEKLAKKNAKEFLENLLSIDKK